MSASALDIKSFISNLQDLDRYQKINWEGSLQQYIEMVRNHPEITRNSFQRLYDCINHFGTEEYVEFKKKITAYNFFKDPIENGKDAVFGIDVHLQKLVNVLKAAAQGYGTEKRVILLHGPVGSAKSTIARMLKKGVEWYAHTDEGAMYTFKFRIENESLCREILNGQKEFASPMNEEPLKLVPLEHRKKLCEEINRGRKEGIS